MISIVTCLYTVKKNLKPFKIMFIETLANFKRQFIKTLIGTVTRHFWNLIETRWYLHSLVVNFS